ncbi:MAG: DNA gyrase C-terminal beta-propeller domain-containing protein, partial [Chloroflexota bacterium]
QYGNILRSPVSALRVMGRATQGVRLINLRENDIIASVASVFVSEDNEDDLKDFEENKPEADDTAGEENGKEFED